MIAESLYSLTSDAADVLEPGASFAASFTFENRSTRRSGAMRIAWETSPALRVVDVRRGEKAVPKSGSIGNLAPGEEACIIATFKVADTAACGDEIALQATLVAGNGRRIGSNVVRRYVSSKPSLQSVTVALQSRTNEVAELLVGVKNAGTDTARDVVARVALNERVQILACERSAGTSWTPVDAASLTCGVVEVALGDVAAAADMRVRVTLTVDGRCLSGALRITDFAVRGANAQVDPLLARAAAIVDPQNGVVFGESRIDEAQLRIESGRSGDVVGVDLIVPNAGTGPARNVDVVFDLPAQVQIVPGTLKALNGNLVKTRRRALQIAEIGPGETVILRGRALLTSDQEIDVVAAANVGPHRCETAVSIAAAHAVGEPRFAPVAASAEAGSRLPVTLRVPNIGTAPACDVRVFLASTHGIFEPAEATINEIAPGGSVDVASTLLLPASIEDASEDVVIHAKASIGGHIARSQDLTIVLYGTPRLEISTLPIAAAATPSVPAKVEVRVENRGTCSVRDVRVAAIVPPGMQRPSDLLLGTLAAGESAMDGFLVAIYDERPSPLVRIVASSGEAALAECALSVPVVAEPQVRASVQSSGDAERIDVHVSVWNEGEGTARRVLVRHVDDPRLIPASGSLRVNGRALRDAFAFKRGVVLERLAPNERATIEWTASVDPSTADGDMIAATVQLVTAEKSVTLSAAPVRYESFDAFAAFISEEVADTATLAKRADQSISAGAAAVPTPLAAELRETRDEQHVSPVEEQCPDHGECTDVLACGTCTCCVAPQIERDKEIGQQEQVTLECGSAAVGVAGDEQTSTVEEHAPNLSDETASWLESVASDFSGVHARLDLTGARLRQISRLLMLGRGHGYFSHICALRAFMPGEVVGAHAVDLAEVRRVFDNVLLRIQVSGVVQDAASETDESRMQLVAFLEAAEAAQGHAQPSGAGVMTSSATRREIAEDLAMLRYAPLGSAYAIRALARWIPTSVDDADLAEALRLYRSTLLDELDGLTEDGWHMLSSSEVLDAQLERLRDALENAFQVERG